MAALMALLLHSCLLSVLLLLCTPATSLTIDYGTQRYGWDLHPQPIHCDTSQQCAQLCEKEHHCISWSYRRPNCHSLPAVAAGCWLKQALAGAQLDPCSDSGWIEERMTPRCADSEYQVWPNSQRNNPTKQSPPIDRSTAILGVQLAVNCTITYTKSDTWYCSWAADDTLRCMYEDGTVNGVKVNGHPANQSTPATSGLVTVVGNHPFHLSLHNATTVSSALSGYIGRFPSANIYHDRVWYVANAVRNNNNTYIASCGGHCVMGPLAGFMTSTDDGRSWSTAPLDLWQQHSGGGGERLTRHVKFGEVHVVDLGRAQQYGSDGYMYVIGHGSSEDEWWGESWELWNQADALYMARVVLTVSSVNEAEEWEFWCGDDSGWVVGAVVGGGVECAAALLVWPNRTGSVSMTYVPSLDRYLTIYTTPHTANRPLDGSDLVLLESTHITGPFRWIDQLTLFGPTAYFPTVPSKFISPHLTVHSTSGSSSGTSELQLWLAFSTLSTYKYNTYGSPPFTAYAWNLMSAKLTVSTAAVLTEADKRRVDGRLVDGGGVVGLYGVWWWMVRLLVWWLCVVLFIGVVRLNQPFCRPTADETRRGSCGQYAYSVVGNSD